MDLDDLAELQGDLKTLSKADYQRLKKSIVDLGFSFPAHIWRDPDGKAWILDAHQRCRTLKNMRDKEGWTIPPLPICEVEAKDIKEAKRKCLAAASQYGVVESQGLYEFMSEADLSLPEIEDSFRFPEIDMGVFAQEYFKENDRGDPDEIPEVKTAISKPGDLWILGDHRILCGDSTKAEDVARLMGGEKAGLCFTSPPYAQQRDYGKKINDWDELMRGVFSNLPVEADAQLLINIGLIHRKNEWVSYWDKWIIWMQEKGWRRFGWYVWDQGFGLPGDWNGRLAPSHEFVFHFNRESVRPAKWVDKKPENIKPRNTGESTMRGQNGKTKAFSNPAASGQPTKIPDSVIRIGRQVGSDGHPAQYPVALPAFGIQTWPGNVYEPFLGSGTTMIAAEKTGRRCFALEIEPIYCDVSVIRWCMISGKEAILDRGGYKTRWGKIGDALREARGQ